MILELLEGVGFVFFSLAYILGVVGRLEWSISSRDVEWRFLDLRDWLLSAVTYRFWGCMRDTGSLWSSVRGGSFGWMGWLIAAWGLVYARWDARWLMRRLVIAMLQCRSNTRDMIGDSIDPEGTHDRR